MRKLAILGCGKMASCLLPSITKQFPAAAITVTRRTESELEKLQQDFSVNITNSNTAALHPAPDDIILAAKPQQIPLILDAIAQPISQLPKKPNIISIAAGLSVESIEHHLGSSFPVLRVMPNTSALVGAGMTGLYANPLLDEETHRLYQSIFDSVGKTVNVKNESELDIVTAVSGCGPAYFYLFASLLAKEATQAGLSPEAADQVQKVL
jgi:pyrroline-5-carboxylate reductase